MNKKFLYSVERVFPFELSKVWAAWTDPVALEEWYHPTDLSCVEGTTASDLQIGGLWACAVAVPQFDYVAYFYGQYTAIEEFALLEHTMHYTQSREEFDLKDMKIDFHDVVINFEVRDQGTWAKFSQFGELPEGEEKRAQAGMESYFDSLGDYLASR